MLKVALCAFLLRFAVEPIHVWLLRALIIGCTVFGIVQEGMLLFQCRPISTFWTVKPNSEFCVNPRFILVAVYTAASLNAIVDWTVGILPYFIVRSLKLPSRTKFLVVCILAFAAM
jgi:hypothetical protein